MTTDKVPQDKLLSDQKTTNLLHARSFIEACLDERQTKAFQRMYERLDGSFRNWANEQYKLIAKTPKVDSVLSHSLKNTAIIDGLVCEFGVCTGSSTNLMADSLKQREVFGFDSFEGFPTDWIIGAVKVPKDMLAVDETKLKFSPNVRLVKGFFSDSSPISYRKTRCGSSRAHRLRHIQLHSRHIEEYQISP